MRLLNTTQKTAGDFETKEFFDDALPDYAILSHTWGEEEVSYQDLKNGEYANMKGYAKIKECCSIARSRNIVWVWIDTCCIDKTSSAELTEAINSMYRWYQQAKVCYAFLEDVPARPFPESRWFTRGWTLQELIAPDTVVFLNRDWEEIGTRDTLQCEISESTGIPLTILSGAEELGAFSVAQRMSWASRRRTSRIEDRAYSLLGIFGINMPLIYGEGIRAFIRLQEEIVRTLEDYTIFAWKDGNSHGGLLAPSPDAFADSASFVRAYHSAFATKETWTMSNRGVRMRLPFMGIGPGKLGLAALNCTKAEKETQLLAIYLRDVSGTMQRFERVLCDTLEAIDEDTLLPSRFPGRQICVPQPAQLMQSGFKTRQKDSAQCLEALRTIFTAEDSSSIGVEFFEKVAMRGQRMATEGRMDGSSPRWRGYSELTHAASKGDIELIQSLLASGHDVNAPDDEGRTALSTAADAGQTLAAWFLMCRPSIHVNLRDQLSSRSYGRTGEGSTPLHNAASRGHEDVVWLLLSRGDIRIHGDSKSVTVYEPVMSALRRNHKKIVEMFLARDDFDVTKEGLAEEALCAASVRGDEATMRVLLDRIDLYGAKPAGEDFRTPEKYAAQCGHERIVELLIARGADINERRLGSMIEIAAEHGQKAVISLLLDRGVEFDLVARALKKAAEAEHMDIVWLLLESSYGKLLLRDVIELLLMSDAKPQIISALHMNARILLACGANRIMCRIDVNRDVVPHIDMTDKWGRTLLSWAAEHGHDAVVDVLFRHGADITLKDNIGRTALDMAQDGGHDAVLRILHRRKCTYKHHRNRSSGRSNKSQKRRRSQDAASWI